MQVGVLLQGRRAEILLSNPKSLELLGIDEDQLLGKTSFDPDWNVIHEDGSPFPGTSHPVPQAIATRHSVLNVVMGVYRPITRDRIWLSVDAEPQLNDDGTVRQVVCSFINITMRKQSEAALRKSEERYRTLFNNMMDGIYRSTHAGKFVDVNPAMVKMFGYSSREEMLEVDIKKDLYFAPEERGSHILDTGQEETEVYRMRRKDGTEIWVEDHGHYVHDEQGNILYHEGMLRDITARKQADEIIRESEERLAAVVEGSQLGYSDWNIQTGEILRNERWAGMLGYTLKEIETTYQQWEDLIHPDDHAAALQAMQDHLDGKTPIHRDEYRLRAKDGSYRWILDQGKIIEYDPQGHPLADDGYAYRHHRAQGSRSRVAPGKGGA